MKETKMNSNSNLNMKSNKHIDIIKDTNPKNANIANKEKNINPNVDINIKNDHINDEISNVSDLYLNVNQNQNYNQNIQNNNQNLNNNLNSFDNKDNFALRNFNLIHTSESSFMNNKRFCNTINNNLGISNTSNSSTMNSNALIPQLLSLLANHLKETNCSFNFKNSNNFSSINEKTKEDLWVCMKIKRDKIYEEMHKSIQRNTMMFKYNLDNLKEEFIKSEQMIRDNYNEMIQNIEDHMILLTKEEDSNYDSEKILMNQNENYNKINKLENSNFKHHTNIIGKEINISKNNTHAHGNKLNTKNTIEGSLLNNRSKSANKENENKDLRNLDLNTLDDIFDNFSKTKSKKSQSVHKLGAVNKIVMANNKVSDNIKEKYKGINSNDFGKKSTNNAKSETININTKDNKIGNKNIKETELTTIFDEEFENFDDNENKFNELFVGGNVIDKSKVKFRDENKNDINIMNVQSNLSSKVKINEELDKSIFDKINTQELDNEFKFTSFDKNEGENDEDKFIGFVVGNKKIIIDENDPKYQRISRMIESNKKSTAKKNDIGKTNNSNLNKCDQTKELTKQNKSNADNKEQDIPKLSSISSKNIHSVKHLGSVALKPSFKNEKFNSHNPNVNHNSKTKNSNINHKILSQNKLDSKAMMRSKNSTKNTGTINLHNSKSINEVNDMNEAKVPSNFSKSKSKMFKSLIGIEEKNEEKLSKDLKKLINSKRSEKSPFFLSISNNEITEENFDDVLRFSDIQVNKDSI